MTVPRCADCSGLVRAERGRSYLPAGSKAVRWLCQGCQVGKPSNRLYTPKKPPETSVVRIDTDALADDPREALEGSP